MDINNIVNVSKFGDGASSCSLPFQLHLQGENVWSQRNLPQDNPQFPLQISIVDNTILVLYSNGIIGAFSPSDGKALWNRYGAPRMQMLFSGNRTVLLDNGSRFSLLDMKNKTEEFYRLPFVSDGLLWYFQISKSEIQYVYSKQPQMTSGPSMQPNGPSMSYLRYAVSDDDNEFRCEIIRQGFLLNVLSNADKSIIYLVNDKVVYLIGADSENDAKVKEIVLNEIKGAGLDKKGNICLTGRSILKIKKTEQIRDGLFCFDKNGKELWYIPISDDFSGFQPPAVQFDGTVYLIAGGSLKKINTGKIEPVNPDINPVEWSFDLPCVSDDAFISILADMSVLVAAGQSLLHIDKDCNLIKQMVFTEKLVCRPVADGNGNIFVGSAANIYCVH